MTRGSKHIMPCTNSASIRGKAENVVTLVPFVIRFRGDGLCASIFISVTNNALLVSSDNPHK